ncbi:putative ribonuclease H-like domain-containing protein [Tanacetum coccineum]
MLPLGEEPEEEELLVNELLKLMCDKKNSVLFTDTTCFVLSPNFKLPDESQVLLKVPRINNMYSVDMKNIVSKESLTCLVAKVTLDESMLWHRRLGHTNFKTINKLVKDNLVRGLPAKRFENDQTCVACLKGKQHKASCKSKIQNSITQPLFMLYMDLFSLTFVSSLMNKKYCLVVTDDYSRFTWVFFLASKDETSGILKNFITEIENLVDKKVKIIRFDNGIEFKNRVMNEFCKKKCIKREFYVARTPQQNGVAKRRNRTLIKGAITMLADSKLPTTFWAEAVNTACYVQNRVIIVKPHNKTPYELFRGRTPALSFMRPFGCHVTILNTLDRLGKFDGKSNDGFFVGYSLTSTNYNDFAGSEKSNGAGHTSKETGFSQDYIMMPMWKDGLMFDSSSKNSSDDEPQPSSNSEKKDDEGVSKASGFSDQEQPESNTLNINTSRPKMDMSNLTTLYQVPTTPNTRIYKDHLVDHVIGDIQSGVQTRGMTKNTNKHRFISDVYEGKTHEDLHTYLFACFLSQEEPKKIAKALSDPAWVESIQEELLQFKLQKVWILVDLPKDGCEECFFYGIIKEKVYVCQPPGFEDPDYPDKVYKVMSYMGELNFFLGLQVKQRVDGIFISQDKYVAKILRKFGFTDVRTTSTPMNTKNPLLKDSDGDDVDVHLYKSMIGSLMYLTSSRPHIMFVELLVTSDMVKIMGYETKILVESGWMEYIALLSDFILKILDIWRIMDMSDVKE